MTPWANQDFEKEGAADVVQHPIKHNKHVSPVKKKI